jgi:hypothetical protein
MEISGGAEVVPGRAQQMSRRNRRPTVMTEATAAVRSPLAEALGFRSPELMIEIV